MDNNESESSLDKAASRILADMAEKRSRRGWLARIGKVILGAVGITLLPELPLDRRSYTAEAAGPLCSDWQMCGINGRLCNGGGGQNMNSCPGASHVGFGFWSACCIVPEGGLCHTISYYDCCGTDSLGYHGDDCGQHYCAPGGNFAYCYASSGAYVCTIFSESADTCTGGNCCDV